MQVFAPITVLALAVKMPFPELGVEHEAPRVLRANRTRGNGTAVKQRRRSSEIERIASAC